MLVSGYGAYVPLVDDVKRMGKRVIGAGFRDGLSPDLRRAVDHFVDLTDYFLDHWVEYLRQHPQAEATLPTGLPPE